MPTATPRRIGSPMMVVLSVLLGLLMILFGLYAGISKRYETVFLPGTTLNGLDVSGMNLSQAERVLQDSQEDYALTITERDSVTETITGEQIDLSMVFGNALAEGLAQQNHWSWPLAVFGSRSFPVEAEVTYSYDTAKLTEAISHLKCMNSAASTPPRDAYLSGFNAETGGVEVVQEVQGNLVDQSILLPAIQDAIATMKTSLDLEELDCYVKPAVTADDPALQAKAKQLNEYLGTKITYQMGKDKIEITGRQLVEWLSFDDEGNVSLNNEKVTAFVRQLAHDYNTIYANRTFKTSSGKEITVEGGDYGWWMNEPEEVEQLSAQILNKESGTREPVWRQKAAVLGAGGSGDIGGTYVEVNLTAQHIYFYKDGKLVLESDCVTGKNDGTPTGTYSFTYKERYATLKGENYSSPVSFWMPFSGNVGLHDATWRTQFGGNLYQAGGSHGCVNLPIKTAKYIYENIDAETAAVIVYKLDGTQSSETSSQSYEDIASAIVEALDEIESSGAINSGNYNVMKKRIEWAQAAYSHLSGSAKAEVTNYEKLEAAVSALKRYQNG